MSEPAEPLHPTHITGKPPAAAGQSQVPDTLLHFRLDRLLARGGMGAVYLGYDLSLERPVAVKTIVPEFAQQQSFLDRFLREARAQAQVAHSNVVQVYYVGKASDTVFMAMELVDGGSLELKPGETLSWQDAVRHMTGLTEGLREAARLNIIHRDIKPANILLDRFGLAHLADFGLAAPVYSSDAAMNAPVPSSSAPNLPRLTQVGMVMGTPAYMAPEQARGEVLDVRADVYALGATFYQLLTGRTPTDAGTLHELAAFHQGPPPPTLRSLRPDLPERVCEVIDTCMRRQATDRYQTYDALLDALARAAPRPVIASGSVVRVLAWLIDVGVFALVTRFTFQLFPLIGFAVLALWWLAGSLSTGGSPGLWLMRQTVRSITDTRLPASRQVVRFAVQHGWLAFSALLIASVYSSGGQALTLAWAAAAALLFIMSVGGSLLAFSSKERRTLVDRLCGGRVVVDVRSL